MRKDELDAKLKEIEKQLDVLNGIINTINLNNFEKSKKQHTDSIVKIKNSIQLIKNNT